MAIKAYNAGTNNNLIDTTDKFIDGDMLVFDQTKNLFVKGITRQQLALKTDLTDLTTQIGQIDLTPYATRDYVDGRFASLIDNDRQSLSLVGNTLSIENGNSVDLSTILQNLSLTGSVISISEGNQIDIGPLIDEIIASAGLVDQDGNTVDLSDYITQTELNTALANYQPTVDLSTYYTKTEVDALIPAVFSGDYNDLINQPDLTQYVTNTSLQQTLANYQPTVDLTSYYTKTEVDALIPAVFSGSYNDLTDTPILFSGNYNDLTNKPTIPSDISQLTDTQGLLGQGGGGTVDLTGYATEVYVQNQLSQYQPTVDLSNYVTTTYFNNTRFSGDYNDLTNKPNLFSGDFNDLINKPTVFSGNYNDLYNQPTIPSIDGLATTTYVDQQIAGATGVDLSNYYNKSEVDALVPTPFSGNYNDLYNKPSLDGFATTAYVDQQIANVGSGGNVDLSSYVTDTELANAIAGLGSHFSGDYNDLTNKPTLFDGQYSSLTGTPVIPTDINQLADSSGLLGQGGGNVDLTGYATQAYVNQQISAASIGGIANINDLNDVAIDGTETTNHVLMYNAVNQLWENVDLDETFATRDYVTTQVAQVVSGGQLDLSGYATESYVTQKLLERGDHFSGDYNDLANTPILFSGDYRDLINAPADNSDLRLVLNGNELQLLNIEPEPDTLISTVKLDDLGAAVSTHINYENVQNLPNIFSGDYNDLINRPNLFSGSYNDLTNKPYIPSIAGLATEQYVNDKHAEPTLYGDKVYAGSVTFEDFTLQKTSIVSHAAQKREYALAIQTTNAIPTEVLLPDSTRLGLGTNTTAMFKATFVAVSNTTSASFNIRGVINVGTTGSAQLIGDNILETIADGGTTWGGNITAHVADDAMLITVTGADATTVDWTVFVELTEVKR